MAASPGREWQRKLLGYDLRYDIYIKSKIRGIKTKITYLEGYIWQIAYIQSQTSRAFPVRPTRSTASSTTATAEPILQIPAAASSFDHPRFSLRLRVRRSEPTLRVGSWGELNSVIIKCSASDASICFHGVIWKRRMVTGHITFNHHLQFQDLKHEFAEAVHDIIYVCALHQLQASACVELPAMQGRWQVIVCNPWVNENTCELGLTKPNLILLSFHLCHNFRVWRERVPPNRPWGHAKAVIFQMLRLEKNIWRRRRFGLGIGGMPFVALFPIVWLVKLSLASLETWFDPQKKEKEKEFMMVGHLVDF